MIDNQIRLTALKADLIRLLLIKKYGGLWADASTFFLTDFSWTENPNRTLIHNKFGSSPDIILAAFTFTGQPGETITQ